MTLFIIPDVHQDWMTARKLRESNQALSSDAVVWLGDFLDDFDSTKEDFIETLKVVHDAFDRGDRVLFGSHDLQYVFGPRYICSGYQSAYKELIDDDLRNLWREKGGSSLTVEHDESATVLLSHAGFCDSLLDFAAGGKDHHFVKTYLKEGVVNSVTSAGWVRGGKFPYGGPFWLDWNVEFMPVEGFNQVVGHTRSKEIVRECSAVDGSSINFCIDNGLQSAMLLNSETMEYEMVTV